MKARSVTAALGFAALLIAAPLLASAQTAQPGPIQLDHVEIAQSYGIFDDFLPGLVSIGFTNENSSTATNVVFDLLNANGDILAQFNDVGSFPQGTGIHHRFEDTHEDPGQQLEVSSVTFADGTTWSAPSHNTLPATILPSE
jgi:hypothetical protein